MSYSVLEIDKAEHVATVWLANPAKRNAMGPAFWQELPLAMTELSEDSDVRAIVVAAQGAHFTAGLDLTGMATVLGGDRTEAPASEVAKRRRALAEIGRLQRSISSVADCPKPVIAAIHGYCIGGGVDLITACDVRVASADATFSIRETRIAIVADVGTLQRLPGIVGRGIAAELALSGDDFSAQRAFEIGLVNSVHADAPSTHASALALAGRIARNSPLAVQGTKEVLRYCQGKSVEDGLAYVAAWNTAFLESNDLKEAIGAFFEKRTPKFTGS